MYRTYTYLQATYARSMRANSEYLMHKKSICVFRILQMLYEQ
jgi:hypothetical protein